MVYENIIVERKDSVGIITLNRPKSLNALSAALTRELEAALQDLDNDAAVGCMILTGSDKAFAAGADIKEMQSKTFRDVYLQDFITVAWEHVAKVRKPIIAAVSGYALGGGCEMAMMLSLIHI